MNNPVYSIRDAELRPYQRDGARWLEQTPYCLLADEMGLGKTVQVIAWANAHQLKRVLVVCPAGVKLNWQREWQARGLYGMMVAVVEGKEWAHPAANVVVINYDILQKHRAHLRETLWDAIVLDEAHYIKNATTQRTKEILGSRQKKLSAIPACKRIALTGTPLLNRPIELYTILRWLRAPNMPANELAYALRYCAAQKMSVPKRGGGRRTVWNFNGASNLTELTERILWPILLRRKKADVLLELPDKVRQIIEFNISYPGLAYNLLAKAAHKLVDTVPFEVVVQTLTSMMPQLAEMSKIRKEEALVKIPFVIEFLENAIASSGKVVCFCHHREVVEALMVAFKDDAVAVVGGMTSEAKQRAVDAFQMGDKKLFIGNIQAAGVGITLTAASHVVFAELSWVPGEMAQAEDRCHRFGQKNSVLVQYLVCDNSLEAAMAKALIKKQKILSKVLDNQAS